VLSLYVNVLSLIKYNERLVEASRFMGDPISIKAPLALPEDIRGHGRGGITTKCYLFIAFITEIVLFFVVPISGCYIVSL